jgi:glycosyltransferase involved in cell wall biosynthesis
MKVLIVSLGFPPAIAWGGPVRVAHEHAVWLSMQGHQVTVCASNRLDKGHRIAPGTFERWVDGVRAVYLGTYMLRRWPGTVGPTLFSPRALRRLWREICTAEVVHVHGIRNALVVAAALLCRWSGTPLVIQPHGAVSRVVGFRKPKWFYDYTLMPLLLQGADAVIALHMQEVGQIAGAGGDRLCVHIVPNALGQRAHDVEPHRGRFRARYGITSGQRVILSLGRINKVKGMDLLVEAFARLPEGLKRSCVLVLAGPNDGHRVEVERAVARHGLRDHVVFTGLLDRKQVGTAHVDADLFVLASRKEAFPMAVLEACQAGTPILLSDRCEIADVIADRAGMVVPLEVDAIAGGMRRLLYDDALRRRYAAGAQTLSRTEFSIDAAGDRLEVVYQRAIAHHLDRRNA